MVNYYYRFIPNFAQILHSFIDLLKGNTNHYTITAFDTIKQNLSNATKLSHLSTSTEAQIVLKTGASQVAVGAVLQ